MYSLPITTYSDYWHATKVWSSYLSGLAVFAASTQYSTLGAPDIMQTLQQPIQLTTQSSNDQALESKLSFLDTRQRVFSQGSISRGETSSPSLSQGGANQGEASQEVSDQEFEHRTTSRTQVEEKEIPFDTQYVESDKLLPGMSQMQEEGENGVLRQVVKTFEVAGQPLSLIHI